MAANFTSTTRVTLHQQGKWRGRPAHHCPQHQISLQLTKRGSGVQTASTVLALTECRSSQKQSDKHEAAPRPIAWSDNTPWSRTMPWRQAMLTTRSGPKSHGQEVTSNNCKQMQANSSPPCQFWILHAQLIRKHAKHGANKNRSVLFQHFH